MTEFAGTMPDPKHRPKVARLSAVQAPVLRALEEKKKLNPPSLGLVSWWPVAAGLALGFLAPQLRTLLVSSCDPWGMRAIFPFALLAGRHEIGLSDELTRTLPQLMLFLQFPLEGLLTKFTVGQGVKLSKALGQLGFLHAVCFLVLWLISGAAQ